MTLTYDGSDGPLDRKLAKAGGPRGLSVGVVGSDRDLVRDHTCFVPIGEEVEHVAGLVDSR